MANCKFHTEGFIQLITVSLFFVFRASKAGLSDYEISLCRIYILKGNNKYTVSSFEYQLVLYFFVKMFPWSFLSNVCFCSHKLGSYEPLIINSISSHNSLCIKQMSVFFS